MKAALRKEHHPHHHPYSNHTAMADQRHNHGMKHSSYERKKEVLATKVTSTVKLFSVRSGCGFINRCDPTEDVFVPLSAINKNNPRREVWSTVVDSVWA